MYKEGDHGAAASILYAFKHSLIIVKYLQFFVKKEEITIFCYHTLMITIGIVGIIASVFTITSHINTVGNTANLAYDQAIVGQSLDEMSETARLLKEKAEEETDPVKKQEKLLIAEKLSQTHEKMDALQSQMIVRTARKEFANVVKGTIIGNVDRISKIGELGGQVAGTLDGSIDAAVSRRSLVTQGTVDDISMWKMAAKSSEGIDVEIAKVKARQQAKELGTLNDELAQMIREMDEREQAQALTSDEYESELGRLVNENPSSFGIDEQDALAGLDTDTDILNEEESPIEPPTTSLFQPVDSEGILGDNWIITSWAGKTPSTASFGVWRVWPFVFRADGTGKRIISGLDLHYSYSLQSNGVGYLTVNDFTAHGTLTKEVNIEKRFFPELGKTYCIKLEDDQTLYMYRTPTCDLDSKDRYILKRRP